MRRTTRVKVELQNPRYPDRELKERLSELILYARYAGINLDKLHRSLANAMVIQGQDGPEMRYGGKIVIETDQHTVSLVNTIINIYPAFATWAVKVSAKKKSGGAGKGTTTKEEKRMAIKKKAAAKKKPAAKKKAAKKKPAAKKKAAAKKKPAAKKKAAAKKKPAAKKKAAKKRK